MSRKDMNTRLAFLLLPCAWLLVISGFAQGNLTPPGPPAPTMRTLDQLGAKLDQANTNLASTEAKADEINAKAEKRTPISSLPFVISEPGSYYLARNLRFTAATGHAITIAVSDVTLDLMGFTLSSAPEVTGDGIRLNGGVRNIAIKNGNITGNTTVTYNGATWTTAPAGFARGIGAVATLDPVAHCEYSHLRISGCRNEGLEGGFYALIQHVIAARNGGGGISAFDATIAHCRADLNGGTGINSTDGLVSDCTSSRNQGTGISASDVTHCIVRNSGGHGIFARSVSNSIAQSSGVHGIFAGEGSVTHSVAVLSGSDGINAQSGVVSFCKASSNNRLANGSVDIDAAGATRTGNNPTP
jgi:hypothetical protein